MPCLFARVESGENNEKRIEKEDSVTYASITCGITV